MNKTQRWSRCIRCGRPLRTSETFKRKVTIYGVPGNAPISEEHDFCGACNMHESMEAQRPGATDGSTAVRNPEWDLAVIHDIAVSTSMMPIQFTAWDLWIIMSEMQLAFRHPDNNGPSRQLAEIIENNIVNVISAVFPSAKPIALAGRDPNQDQPGDRWADTGADNDWRGWEWDTADNDDGNYDDNPDDDWYPDITYQS